MKTMKCYVLVKILSCVFKFSFTKFVGKKIASIEKNEANFLRKKSQVRNLEKEASISEKEAKIIFNLLDSDNDNIISAKYIDLTQIHPFLLEIIQEVLFEMEAQNTSLSFQDFYKKMKKFMLEKKILEV